MQWTARLIGQAQRLIRLIAGTPLIASFRGNPEALTQRPETLTLLLGELHKFGTKRPGIGRHPGHGFIIRTTENQRSSVTHVLAQVLPMSSVHTLRQNKVSKEKATRRSRLPPAATGSLRFSKVAAAAELVPTFQASTQTVLADFPAPSCDAQRSRREHVRGGANGSGF